MKILHYLKDPKLREVWYVPYFGLCRIYIFDCIPRTLQALNPWAPKPKFDVLLNPKPPKPSSKLARLLHGAKLICTCITLAADPASNCVAVRLSMGLGYFRVNIEALIIGIGFWGTRKGII